MMLALAAEPVFRPFGPLHAGIVLASVGIITLLCVQGAKFSPTPERSRTHALWTWFTICVQVFNVVYYATPPRIDVVNSLPLHICDLAGIFACIDLLSRRRFFRLMMFFWGLGLSTQAFVTPVLTDGPGTIRFWLFFVSHLTIVGTAAYDLASGRFRPTWRDVLIAIGFTTLYGALIIPVNLAIQANYGYVGNTKPDQPTLIDKLGPWPGRLGFMWIIISAWMAMIALPWAIRKPRTDPIDGTGAKSPEQPINSDA